jgi:hypothetical protein
VQFFEDEPPPGALYLALSGGVDVLWSTDPLTYLGGGTLALGVRF